MKLGDAEKILQQMEQQYDLKKTVKDSLMDIPAQDTIHLFGRFATPEHFQDGSNDSVTRENATANLSERDFQVITTVGSIRSNFIRLLRTEYPNDQNIINVIDMIGDDITIRATTSKGKEGWLGNLIITSRRIADIATANLKDAGKSVFGLGRK
jgi:hypothetical protein